MTYSSWKYRLAITLVTLLSSHGFAKSQIVSEFELVLPRQFQQNLIDQKWQSLVNEEFTGNWQFPDQQVLAQEGVPVKIKDIFLNIKTRLQKPALGSSETSLQLISKSLQAIIRIGEISVDHVIEREVGGIIGRFRVQATCKNVTLQMHPGQGEFVINLAPVVGSSKASTEIQSIDLGWTPGSWTSSSLQCEGVQGFDDLLKNEIEKIANDSESFIAPQRERIKQYVQESLNHVKIDFSGSHQLLVSRPDLKVTMIVDQFKDLGSLGAKATGNLQIDFLQAPDEAVKILSLVKDNDETISSSAQIRLPKDFAKEVLRRAYSANTWLHKVTSAKVPGFSSLMNSRFMQFFVWPELMKYPKSSTFRFDLYSNKDIAVTGEGLQYQVQGQLYSKMLAPKNGKYVPFMNFAVPLNSKVQLQVANGKMQATFVNPKLNLTAGWDATYLKENRVSKSFSSKTILNRVVQSLYGQTVSVDIPAIPLVEGISLKVKKVTAKTGQDLVLQLAP